jgi:hypothetical protein
VVYADFVQLARYYALRSWHYVDEVINRESPPNGQNDRRGEGLKIAGMREAYVNGYPLSSSSSRVIVRFRLDMSCRSRAIS